MATQKTKQWNPLARSYRDDPYAYLKALRAQGEICKTINGHALVLSHQLAKDVLRNPEFKTVEVEAHLEHLEQNHLSASEENLSVLKQTVGKWLLFINAPMHSSSRRLMAGLFNQYKLTETIKEVIDEAMSDAVKHESVDVVTALGQMIPTLIMSRLMGLDEKVTLSLRDGLYAVGRIMEPFLSMPRLLEYDDSATELLAYFQREFQDKKENPGEDYISRLIQDAPEDMSMPQLVSLGLQLFWAGVETTIQGMSQVYYFLVRNPEEWQKIKKNPDLVKSATEEILRMACPAQYTIRLPEHDIDLSGMHVKAGEMVYVSMGAANRDPSVFTEADRFDAARSPNPHISFGHGSHSCLGMQLARQEIAMLLEWMIEHDVEITAEEDPKWHQIIMMRGIESWEVKVSSKN